MISTEERIAKLEKKVDELYARLAPQPRKKDPSSTFGKLPDDEFSRSADQLGREYREEQTYERELAGS